MTWRFDLFVVHAATDADFVRGFLLPALHSRGMLVSPTYIGGDSPGLSFAGSF